MTRIGLFVFISVLLCLEYGVCRIIIFSSYIQYCHSQISGIKMSPYCYNLRRNN